MTHEFDLLWDFHGVQEKAMKYIQIFHGVQIDGNLMGWKIHWGIFNGHEDAQSSFSNLFTAFSWSMKCIL